jgi:CRP-like cAMP-binding protein
MDKEVKKTIQDFYETFPLKRLERGEVLIRPDETLKNIFYLVEGTVTQYDISAAGNEVVVNVFKPGAFFPMSMAINKTPNYYFFETSSPTTVHVAPARKAVAFIKDNPDVMFDLLSRVYKGSDGLLRRMAHLMGGNARTRLIFEILNAAYRFGERDAEGNMLVPLTENDLAKRSGLSRETISRTMHKLKNDGIVKVQPFGVVIFELDRLEDLLGTDL